MFSKASCQEDPQTANEIQLDALFPTSSIKEFNGAKNIDDNWDLFDVGKDYISSNNAHGSSVG